MSSISNLSMSAVWLVNQSDVPWMPTSVLHILVFRTSIFIFMNTCHIIFACFRYSHASVLNHSDLSSVTCDSFSASHRCAFSEDFLQPVEEDFDPAVPGVCACVHSPLWSSGGHRCGKWWPDWCQLWLWSSCRQCVSWIYWQNGFTFSSHFHCSWWACLLMIGSFDILNQ